MMTRIVIAFGLIATAAATAQTLVVGTGNPDVDITAVQAAVDRVVAGVASAFFLLRMSSCHPVGRRVAGG